MITNMIMHDPCMKMIEGQETIPMSLNPATSEEL